MVNRNISSLILTSFNKVQSKVQSLFSSLESSPYFPVGRYQQRSSRDRVGQEKKVFVIFRTDAIGEALITVTAIKT